MSDFEVYEETMDFIKNEATEQDFEIIDIQDETETLLSCPPNESTKQVSTMIDFADLTPDLSTPVINIIDTLRSSITGVALMTHYRNFKDLEEEHRLHITDIIVEREMRSNRDLTIKPERFEQLADLIIETFPTEDKDTYYIPYRFDQGAKKKISAKGKLYNKLLYYRSLLINSGAVRRDKRGKKRKSQADDAVPARLAFRSDLTLDYEDEEIDTIDGEEEIQIFDEEQKDTYNKEKQSKTVDEGKQIKTVDEKKEIITVDEENRIKTVKEKQIITIDEEEQIKAVEEEKIITIDEEEQINIFDKEARTIVPAEQLPKKSSERYILVYNLYKKWRIEHEHLLSNSEENNLIGYFNELKDKLRPSTLWSIWSMLKTTLGANDDININNYLKLKRLIKNNAKNYKPSPTLTLKWGEILKFMTEAPDDVYLLAKVVLVFGVSGALRCEEITRTKCKDVEELNNRYLITVRDNRGNRTGQFIIVNLFYSKVKKYMSLRPDGEFGDDRFFIHYQNSKCTRQPIGRHKIGEVPKMIASYLRLGNAARYTGHCFRKTAATLLSQSGGNRHKIKEFGRLRSDMIGHGEIENSMQNEQLIFYGIPDENTTVKTFSKPSTSNETVNTCSKSSTMIDVTTSYMDSEPEINYDYDSDPLDISEDFKVELDKLV